MANDKMRTTTLHHSSIKKVKKIEAMVGGAKNFTKGIKLGTSTTSDKHGVAGSWKNSMAGGK